MIPQSGATRQPQNTPIFVRGRERPVGYVTGGVFRKSVRASVHFLTRPRAIAFDRSTIEDAENAGALTVEVTDSETGNVYGCALDTIWRHSFDVHRGYGNQVALALPYWRVNNQPPAPVWESNQAVKTAQP
ncbi:MAG: hypothetical protein HY328_15630 [Chloroflexi bacterium]|nr:hypothetical protein [Chloroflexota bacterium]